MIHKVHAMCCPAKADWLIINKKFMLCAALQRQMQIFGSHFLGYGSTQLPGKQLSVVGGRPFSKVCPRSAGPDEGSSVASSAFLQLSHTFVNVVMMPGSCAAHAVMP